MTRTAPKVPNRCRPLLRTLILAAALTAGCGGIGGPPPQIDYYALEYDPPARAAQKPLPVVLRVGRFGISPLYDDRRMVYRTAEFRRDAYVYHRWWANPAEMVPHFLARDLEATGLFKGVFVFDPHLPATHVLEGNVEAFYEEDRPEAWWAVLSLRISLLSADEPDASRRVLFQASYAQRQPSDRKTPEALAAAMSRAMARASESILADVYRRLETAVSSPSTEGSPAP